MQMVSILILAANLLQIPATPLGQMDMAQVEAEYLL
jgi:hypothetical protein